ncbi:MAG TPA: prolyl-tRNA synthetase associated domain-containing protein [Lachnospiraceae bacterium]|nr:prolyl-tRNA synthetase associated domain-containing protein [Lachnospiraceae bacterium]
MNDTILDRTIYTTRPDPTTRLTKENRVYDLLEQLSIPFKRLDHEVTDTIESCHDVDRLLDINICKNLFLCNASHTNFYLLMIPGEKKFKTSVISKQINSSRLSFAEPEYMTEFLDITPGSVSVLGLMNDSNNRVQLLIDEDVLKDEYFGCHPCINTSSLKIRIDDLLHIFLPYVKHDVVYVTL